MMSISSLAVLMGVPAMRDSVAPSAAAAWSATMAGMPREPRAQLLDNRWAAEHDVGEVLAGRRVDYRQSGCIGVDLGRGFAVDNRREDGTV
jgi:hypothetical protein